ncbi:SOUL heme-binding protein [Haematococcus lacustris]
MMRCARLHLQRQGCSVPHVPLAAAFASSSDKPRRHALSLSTRPKASEMTTIVVEGAPALLSAADSPSPSAEASTVPHSRSTGRQSTLQQLKEALAQDLQVMFSGGAINGSIYSKDIVFQDPVTYVVGLDMYKAVISFLGLFNVKLHLHDIHVATDYLITARWTMDMTVKVLPWRPQLSFTGTTQYTVDPDVGYVTQHVDTWDALSNQGFLSLEGLAFVLRQALSLQLTPSIETPEYLVLVKKADYEIRQLSPFLVATTQSGTHSGPASGMGFTTLAGYIFGGNKRGEQLEMTTLVFSTVQPGSKSTSMEFVMERRFTDLSQLPEPNDPQNVAKGRCDGGIWAVARFSGWPLDRDVLIAERELRDALCRDGLQAAPGYRLARYNEPTTPPWLRRNEVLIQLPDYQWPPKASEASKV